jgi:hypothetical protein
MHDAQLQQMTTALADRYRVLRAIGRGGMATVYLADDPKHHRQVAIKVFAPELAAILGKDRFLREIELTAGLTHPHILPLYVRTRPRCGLRHRARRQPCRRRRDDADRHGCGHPVVHEPRADGGRQ